jgi:hypothetical protein
VNRSSGNDSSTSAAPALYYLYGVLPAGGHAARRLAAGEIHGLVEGAPLFAIEAAGLLAAVSLVPEAQFAEAPLAELLADLPRLTPLAVRHENAVHALAEGADAVVPVTFGAIYRDATAVERLLRRGATQLHALLERVRGRQEWGVKLFAEPAVLARAAEAESEELRRTDAAIAAATPGRAYLLAKSRERTLVHEVELLATGLAEDVVHRLAPLSAETCRDELAPASGPARLLLKAAFLVETGAAERFLAEASVLERQCAARGLSLQCSGPWAPYSFVADGISSYEMITTEIISDAASTGAAGDPARGDVR